MMDDRERYSIQQETTWRASLVPGLYSLVWFTYNPNHDGSAQLREDSIWSEVFTAGYSV
jgi:hypothetical protein